MELELALWAACVPCLLLSVTGYVRIARTRGGFRERGRWHAPLLFTSAALALLAALVPNPVVPAFLAVLPLVLITAMVYRAWEATAQAPELGKGAATWVVLVGLWRCIRHELRGARDDLRALTGRGRGEEPQQPSFSRTEGTPPSAATPGTPDAQAIREVPPIRQDPALGPTPEPAEVAAGMAAAGVAVPEPWAALAAWIAGFEPEDDNDQSRFIHGSAAGAIAVADALHAHGDHIVSAVRLDPSYGAALLDLGDAFAAVSGDAVLVDQRYHVIYGEIKAAVQNGLILPLSGDWFGDGSAPQDGPSESAA
jgi:hypothetical protein